MRGWGEMWSLRGLVDLSREVIGLMIRTSAMSLQAADIWWVSFRKTMISTILLPYRTVWPLLVHRIYSPKAESTHPSCCRGPAFVPHTHRHMHPIFLQWVSLGSVTNVFRVCQQGWFFFWECSMPFSWLEHEVLHPEKRHSTSNSDAGLFRASSSLLRSSSSARRVTGYLPWQLQQRSQGRLIFHLHWELLALLAVVRRR